jgi:dienelactone hydrolase
MYRSHTLLAAAFCCAIAPVQAAADTTVLPGLIRAPLSVPITLPNGNKFALEGLVIRPDKPGKFPLVILVHGTPRGEGEAFFIEIARASPAGLNGPAVAFAQRGYAAVSILRRGFGRSEGPFAERVYGPCDNRDYLEVGRTSGEDVAGAVAALGQEPWVDPDRVLLLGLSSGGFAATAAAATNPAGVVGVLSFAGGRGSFAPDQTCSADRLVQDFGIFGRTARVPALWIYSENDHFFAPALARRMFESYAAAGAPAHLEILPPFGADGHVLLLGPSRLWWPAVETFLTALHLPTSVAVELPALAALPAPAPLSPVCTRLFDRYVAARTDAKAFAVNPEGHCGFNVTARSLDDARQEAMTRCTNAWKDCTLYAAGHALVERSN